MAHMKYSVKKKTVWEGKKQKAVTKDKSGKDKTGVSSDGTRKRRFRLGTKALKEIWRFQKSTELLISKVAFYHIVCEILQKENSWYKIQASALLALHEATKAYLMWLFKDSNLCVIHAKCITIMLKDV